MSRLAAAFILLLLAVWGGATEARDMDVSFAGAGGVRLEGTLTTPDRAGPWPAMLLLQGSGPIDRNGNAPTLRTDLLQHMAEALAAAGIASLRYDKRGMYANAREQPQDPAQLAAFYSWNNFLGDVAAAFRFLAARPGVDPAKVGIAGHSEGGVFALAVAPLVHPAVLVLAASPGRKLGAVIQDQLVASMANPPVDAPDVHRVLTTAARIEAAILSDGRVPPDVPVGLRPIFPFYAGPFLRGLLSFDPEAALHALPIPTLVLQGEADNQISPARDGGALARALSGRTDGSAVFMIPNVEHLLMGTAGTLDPTVRRHLIDWLTSQLNTSPGHR